MQVRPSSIAPLAFALARFLNESYGVPLPPSLGSEDLKPFGLDVLAKKFDIEPALLKALGEDLKRAGKSALVLAGVVHKRMRMWRSGAAMPCSSNHTGICRRRMGF